jgi:cyclopropane fatty-acyl-phospholipid synthase-like methyltransferase
MRKDKALQIIAENKKSYNMAAENFSETRQNAWPEFELLKPYINEGESLLDIGCGNGRLWQFLNAECRM